MMTTMAMGLPKPAPMRATRTMLKMPLDRDANVPDPDPIGPIIETMMIGTVAANGRNAVADLSEAAKTARMLPTSTKIRFARDGDPARRKMGTTTDHLDADDADNDNAWRDPLKKKAGIRLRPKIVLLADPVLIETTKMGRVADNVRVVDGTRPPNRMKTARDAVEHGGMMTTKRRGKVVAVADDRRVTATKMTAAVPN